MLVTLDPQSMKPTHLPFSLLHLLPFLFSYHPLTPSLIHLTFLSMILSPERIWRNLFLPLSTFMCIDICIHMCILKCTCTHGHTHTHTEAVLWRLKLIIITREPCLSYQNCCIALITAIIHTSHIFCLVDSIWEAAAAALLSH